MKKYILLAAVVLTLTACNNEDNYIDEPVAARISATIEAVSRASNVKWDAGDNIGITMSGVYTNIRYTTENGDGVFNGTVMYFRNKKDAVTLTAYYPYSGDEGETPAVVETSTGIERQTEDEQPKFDFLYAVKENVTGAEPDVNFVFSHMMSKLTLTFENGNDGTDVSKITSCEINGLVMDGTFNPATGVCAASTTTSAAALSFNPTVEDGKALPSFIFFPQSVDKVTMKIIDSQNQEYSCELKFDGNKLESGNNYTYTITVKKTGLNVKDYQIVDWTESTLGSEAVSD